MSTSSVTTHVLDTSVGRPAPGVAVHLERHHRGAWETVGRGETDLDGRVRALAGGEALESGTYRLTFATGAYFARAHRPTFYPHVIVVFELSAGGHYHVPLLISPFGYSTYRGS